MTSVSLMDAVRNSNANRVAVGVSMQTHKSGSSFSGAFDKASSTVKADAKSSANADQKTKLNDQSSIADKDSKAKISDDHTKAKMNPKSDKINGQKDISKDSKIDNKSAEDQVQIAEAIEEGGREMMENAAKALDVSVEDIEKAMEELGLVPADLLNRNNLVLLVANINGDNDMMSIVTDQDMFSKLQDLGAMADELVDSLADEFDVSRDDIMGQIGQMHEQFADVMKNAANDPMQMAIDQNIEQRRRTSEELSKEQMSQEMNVSEEQADGSQGQLVVDTTAQKSSEENNNSFNGNTPQNMFNQFMDNLTQSVEEATSSYASHAASGADVEHIMNQINDFIKVTARPDITEMEMSLHPQSLGNVSIVISTGRDGTLAAQFTAQNDAVKAALESQLIQLQQRFEEQGMKVTSIEVTVQSHSFEQNLQSGDDSRNEDLAGKSPRRTRRINLGDFADLEDLEELDEADRISAEMMAANGNTVDITA